MMQGLKTVVKIGAKWLRMRWEDGLKVSSKLLSDSKRKGKGEEREKEELNRQMDTKE